MDADKAELLARTLVGYSLDVGRNDVVLISGDLIAEPLVDRLYQAVLHADARPIVRLARDLSLDTHLQCSGIRNGGYLNPTRVSNGTPIDCSIGVWTMHRPNAGQLTTQIEAREELAMQSQFLEFAAAGKIRWAVTLWPTDYAAELAGMSRSAFDEMLAAASMLNQAEPSIAWGKVSQLQQTLCDRLETAQKLQIRCPRGTNLTVLVTGRKWVNSCGRCNLPDGEVYSSPLAASAQGTWCSSFPVIYEGETIAGVCMEIKNGRVVSWKANTGQAALQRLLERDEGASIIGEIGIGTNNRLARGTGISLLDEKIAGTVHIGLGTSYPATGGTNRSSVHRDLVCDLRDGGSILVDDEPLVCQVEFQQSSKRYQR